MNLARWTLLGAAVEIGLVGLIYLVAPAFMMGLNGMSLASAGEFHTIRAGYGGAFVAFALLFLAGAVRNSLREAALIALLAFMGGFATGRIVSLIVDGAPPPAFLFVLATELAFAALAVLALRRHSAASGA